MRELAHDPRLLAPVRALLGDDPLLFKDKLILKPAGMSGYLCHQDQAWWQLCPPSDLLSVLVALDDATDANGGLSVYPGCHNRLVTPEGELRNLTDAERAALPCPPVPVQLAAGDAVVVSSLLPHESDTNQSRESRRAFCVTYSAAKHGSLYHAQRDQYLAMKLGELDEEERPHVFVR